MLSDFGISKQLTADDELARTTLGTPYYISPEMCQKQPYNYYTDIWQIGCFLYELTTLNKPFQGDMVDVINQILHSNPKPISPQYSQFLNNLIFSMLQKLPSKRPTIEQLISLAQIQEQFEKLKQIYPQNYTNFKFPVFNNTFDFQIQQLMNEQTLFLNSTKTLNRNKSHNSYKKNDNNIYNYLEKVKQCISPVSNPITPQYMNMNSFLKTLNPKTPQIHSQGIVEIKPHVATTKKNPEPKLNLPKPQNEQTKRKKNLYSKSIYIDLKNLESNDNKKTPNNYQNTPNQNNIPTEKVQHKVFSFADVLFNPKAPTSPNRKICMTNFLKDKIGEIKLEKILTMLQNSTNPLKALEEDKKIIEEILGEQSECISLFKILITNSTTPSGVEQTKYSNQTNFTEFKFGDDINQKLHETQKQQENLIE